MGVKEVVQKQWPQHRRWVKSHACCVRGCQNTRIDFAHVKSWGSGGQDWQAVSLCRNHHVEQHAIGIETFAEKHGVDLWQRAADFASRTPDKKMRLAMKEQG